MQSTFLWCGWLLEFFFQRLQISFFSDTKQLHPLDVRIHVSRLSESLLSSRLIRWILIGRRAYWLVAGFILVFVILYSNTRQPHFFDSLLKRQRAPKGSMSSARKRGIINVVFYLPQVFGHRAAATRSVLLRRTSSFFLSFSHNTRLRIFGIFGYFLKESTPPAFLRVECNRTLFCIVNQWNIWWCEDTL